MVRNAMATAALAGTALFVTPGDEAVSEVHIKNSGTIVDQFILEVVGEASAWAVVVPSVVALIPGAEAVVRVKFKPPKAPWVPARTIPFAISIKSRQEARSSLVEEGVLVVGTFQATSAELMPKTAKGRSRARAHLALDNRGNVRVNARLTAEDPDRMLNFTITPPGLTAEPGTTDFAAIRLSPRHLFLTGAPKIQPYKIHIHQERQPTITIDGRMQQEALIPTGLVVALMGLAALLITAVILWFVVLKAGSTSAATAATSSPAAASHSLTGHATAASVTLSPLAVAINKADSSALASAIVTLANNGDGPLHVSSIALDHAASLDFSQTNNCPTVLAPGESCAIKVTFVPSTFGQRDGFIVVVDDSVDSPQRIPVTGVATMALAQLDHDRISFTQNVGASTAPQTVMLTNRGNGPLSIYSVAATGDFKAIDHCPSVLMPGRSCPISVTFAPRAAGARNGRLVVTDNGAPGSHETAALTGFGSQPVASLSTSVLSPGANLGGSAGPETVRVTNTGNGALTIRAITISGAAAGDYRQSSDCLRTLQPRTGCTITVAFSPQGYGLRAASLTLYDDGLGGMQSITLNGAGTAPRPSLSSGYLNFGGRSVGSTSLPQSVALSNAGSGPMAIGSVVLTGDDFTMSTNCGSTLAAGASCTITVTFLPQGTGARSGVVTITGSAGTQRISLSGVGT